MSDSDTFGDSVYQSGDAVDDTDDLDPVESLSGDDPDELMQTGYDPPDREPYNLSRIPTHRGAAGRVPRPAPGRGGAGDLGQRHR